MSRQNDRDAIRAYQQSHPGVNYTTARRAVRAKVIFVEELPAIGHPEISDEARAQMGELLELSRSGGTDPLPHGDGDGRAQVTAGSGPVLPLLRSHTVVSGDCGTGKSNFLRCVQREAFGLGEGCTVMFIDPRTARWADDAERGLSAVVELMTAGSAQVDPCTRRTIVLVDEWWVVADAGGSDPEGRVSSMLAHILSVGRFSNVQVIAAAMTPTRNHRPPLVNFGTRVNLGSRPARGDAEIVMPDGTREAVTVAYVAQ